VYRKALHRSIRYRARFCYDDLPGYLIETEFFKQGSGDEMMSKITFLVPRFQHTAVLDNDADLPIELDLRKQALHGSRQHLGSTDFAAELGKAGLLGFCWHVRH
jgi:hypothetical protein